MSETNVNATGGDDHVIDVRGLTKTFGDKRAVDQLSLSVQRGEIFGFLGPNGSGKTTSIRMICGLLTPDGGEGRCLGYDIRTGSRDIKRHVGYMTQRFSYYEDLSIRENLDFVARVYRMEGRRRVVDEAIERLGLQDRRDQLAGTLSGGWKQRLALAACLLHEPDLLLLDEPTAGVDPLARREFWDQIHHLADDGITVLVTTHYMDEAERCTRLGYISNGRLLAEGTPAELIEQSALTTWTVTGSEMNRLAGDLRALGAAEQVIVFGDSLHVSGSDADALKLDLGPFMQRNGLTWIEAGTRLEDVFIQLMSGEATA